MRFFKIISLLGGCLCTLHHAYVRFDDYAVFSKNMYCHNDLKCVACTLLKPDRIISYTISYYLVVEFQVDIDTIVLLENATTLQQITVVIGWHKGNQ